MKLCRNRVGLLSALLVSLATAAPTAQPTAPAAAPTANLLVCYSTVANLLAGDLWQVTRRAWAEAPLAGLPGGWVLAGVGTTDLVGRNGEIAVDGTVAKRGLYFCDPTDPRPVLRLGGQAMPLLALAACDPATAITAPAVADQPLHAQIEALARAKGLKVAAVRVRGRFRDVRYSLAYNLRKEGTPLGQHGLDTSPYQRLLAAPEAADWWFSGFFAADEPDQALLSIGGKPVHLHGARTDQSLGGHLGAATVVGAELSLYPLSTIQRHLCDLTVSGARLAGRTLTVRVANVGDNGVTHCPLRITDRQGQLLDTDLGSLAPGGVLEARLALPRAPSPPLTVQVDVDKALRERDESNNTCACAGD